MSCGDHGFTGPQPGSSRLLPGSSSPFEARRKRTVWRADFEVDGHVGDALIAACHAVCLFLNFLADGVEVRELAALAVVELTVL